MLYRLIVDSITAPKKSTGELYDYELATVSSEHLEINTPGVMCRIKEKVFFAPNTTMAFLARLMYIDFNPNHFTIKPAITSDKLNSSQNPYQSQDITTITRVPYLNISSVLYQNQIGYRLTEGDIIKLGRLRLKVRKLHFPISSTTDKLSNELKSTFSKDKLCRICYTNKITSTDPLIHPCQCTGSIKFIHLRCLQKWLISKLAIHQNGDDSCQTYTVKPVQCELCKSFLPDFYHDGSALHELLDFSSNQFEACITLETLLSNRNRDKVIYKVNLKGRSLVKLGRSKDCDCQLRDITISRYHAYLSIAEGRVYLCNNNAKFGSSVLLQCIEVPLLSYQRVSIQFGRSLLTFTQQTSMLNWLFCGCCGSRSADYYQQVNSKEIDFENYYVIKRYEEKENEKEDKAMLSQKANSQSEVTLRGDINLRIICVQNANENEYDEL